MPGGCSRAPAARTGTRQSRRCVPRRSGTWSARAVPRDGRGGSSARQVLLRRFSGNAWSTAGENGKDDPSRNGSSRWCALSRCGARSKNRASRRRLRGTSATA
ncbi:CGNR zinc finger domain-containing protein [Micromonospora sp. NPDC049559]|uniref:CGNR zinc finger domain-containing protein n=1 Tax=Micromonospora sp. NPDC049559 TaxID=3155923 RepID=UPI003445502A